MSSLAKAQMDQLESPSPTPHSPDWIQMCTPDHIDKHDNNGNYVSEAAVPIELNGTPIQCCLVPAVGTHDICCTTVVNIGIYCVVMIVWMHFMIVWIQYQ